MLEIKTIQTEMTTKEVFSSPKKAPPSPLTSPKKLETRSRAQIMLEEIVGKKKATLSKDLLKKQLEKSGKANDLKVYRMLLVRLLFSFSGQIG